MGYPKNIHSDLIIDMTDEGASVLEIMKATGQSYASVVGVRSRARESGLLAQVGAGRFPIMIGSLNRAVKSLDKDRRYALVKMIPEGSTVAEFSLALINDAIDEECG